MITEAEFEQLNDAEKLEAYKIFLTHSLYDFCHFIEFTDVNPQTHGEIIYTLESPETRKLITVPRGSLKSSIASIAYPIWLLARNPNLRILIDTEVYSNAVLYLRAIKTILKSERFMSVFGDWEGDVWQEGSIVTSQRTKTYKEPSITCGGIGTVKVGLHFDVIIGDDYNSKENSKTRELAQKVIDHFRLNLNILDPHGIYLIIGTRYSEFDLIGFILRDVLGQKEISEGNI